MEDKGSQNCKHIHSEEWLRVDSAKRLAFERSFVVASNAFVHILNYLGMHKEKVKLSPWKNKA